MYSTWFKIALDASWLALESQQVIALRMAKLAVGDPKSVIEANRMLTEKVIAVGETAFAVSTGAGAARIVRSYRKKVRANRRRLGV